MLPPSVTNTAGQSMLRGSVVSFTWPNARTTHNPSFPLWPVAWFLGVASCMFLLVDIRHGRGEREWGGVANEVI